MSLHKLSQIYVLSRAREGCMEGEEATYELPRR